MSTVNLTPHPIRIYPPDAPDRIDDDGMTTLYKTLEPSGNVARIGTVEEGTHLRTGVPVGVTDVEFGHIYGLPAYDPGTWYVVSLVVALAQPDRPDLLVIWREVRNSQATVVGCRGLARPV